MTGPREMFRRLKSAFLRPYYLLLFYYHLGMYKREVKNAEGGMRSKRSRG